MAFMMDMYEVERSGEMERTSIRGSGYWFCAGFVPSPDVFGGVVMRLMKHSALVREPTIPLGAERAQRSTKTELESTDLLRRVDQGVQALA